MVRTAKGAVSVMPEMVLSATLCCGCGICETLACSQGISPKAVINEYKALLAKNKMRYTADSAEVPAEREYRKISSERWKRALGVSEFDAVPTRVLRMYFDRVELSLSQHIGAPSIPVVKTGDVVKRGQLIAKSADGLSVSLHASIDGVVTVFENDKIRIEKVD
jgi:Na+-translocating ferredoxin:NAD+ oxidoreductase RnfC subunit